MKSRQNAAKMIALLLKKYPSTEAANALAWLAMSSLPPEIVPPKVWWHAARQAASRAHFA